MNYLKRTLAAAAAISIAFLPVSGFPCAVPEKVFAADYTEGATDELKYYQYEDHITIVGVVSSSIKSLEIPDQISGLPVTELGAKAFSSCYYLETVKLPEKLEKIGAYAFMNCRNIKELSIPDSVSSIGNEAFRQCSGLESFTLPASLTELGTAVFTGCKKLSGFSAAKDSKVFSVSDGIVFSDSGKTLAVFPAGKADTEYTVPGTVAKMAPTAFSGCTNLVSVDIPDTVTECGGGLFYGCSSLESVRLPESLTVLGYTPSYNYYSDPLGFFENCTKLRDITFPSGLSVLDYDAFCSCKAFTEFIVPDSVEKIYSGAFENDSALTSITLGSSVIEVSTSAFDGASALEAINVSPENQHYSSKDGVMFDKDAKTLVMYPFGRKESTYTVPSGVTAIGYASFYENPNIEKIVLPASVTELSAYSLNRCSKLTDIVFEDENAVDRLTIGRYALYGSAYQNNCTDEQGFAVTDNGILLAVPESAEGELTIPENVRLAAGASIVNKKVTKLIFQGDVRLDSTSVYWCENLTAIEVNGDLVYGNNAVYSGTNTLTDLKVSGDILLKGTLPRTVVNVSRGRKALEYDISDSAGEKEYYASAEQISSEFDIKASGGWYLDSVFEMKLSDGSACAAIAVSGGAAVYTQDGRLIFSVMKDGMSLGAACADDQDNIYIMWGFSIKDDVIAENMDTCNVIIEKYDKNGKLLNTLGLSPSQTEAQFPFDAGNANMCISGEVLGLLFDTEWLRSSDGYHHQGSVFVAVNSADLSVISIDTLNASHSFGVSMIPTESGFADIQNGDANYRGINFCFYDRDSDSHSRIVGFHSPGKYGSNAAQLDGNATYISLGGLAKSRTTYAITGSGEKSYTSDVFYNSEYRQKKYNVFVRIWDDTLIPSAAAGCAGVDRIDLATGETADSNVIWLTDCAENETVGTVKAVALEQGAYVVLWEKYTDRQFDSVRYVVLDECGNVLRKETELKGARLSPSSVQPVVNGNTLTWAYTNDDEDTLTWYSFEINGNTPVAGDADCDGQVKMNDAVLIMQAISNPDVFGLNGTGSRHITQQGERNADVYERGSKLTPMDALTVQRYLIKLVTMLPESYMK
ncbi:MAG: leucine-rich repeat domain-containing protein [Ruminococcus sp.]|nr:leucine-rich repeat domain-containing protein [Ruminococcus sp.]